MDELKPIDSRCLRVMREARDVKGVQLAARLGIKPATLYEYENGDRVPKRKLLDAAAAALGFPLHHVDRTLAYLRQSDASAGSSAAGPRERAERELEGIAVALGLEWEEMHRNLLRRGRTLALAFVERQAAPVLWARFRAHPPEARAAVVREKEDFRSWALSELVCHESVEMASHDAGEAVALAELACVIAERVPEEEPLRLRVLGYAHVHRGNAIRVQGRSLPAADEAFAHAKPLWKAGEAGDPERLLNEARVLGMEASLRRDQRRLPEALELLDKGLAADRYGERRCLLLNRAKVLEELGKYEEAVATLREIVVEVDDREPHLLLNLRFNLAGTLCYLEEYDQAADLMGETRALALRLGKRLVLSRLDWLQGWIAAGRGLRKEAEAAFERARQEFLAQGIAFDSALVSLELAVLYIEEGRTGEVKTLARELAPIFRSQQVQREGLVTARLFQEAVQKETLTLELARRLREELRKQRVQHETRAGNDPGRK
jgi:tetratricopeptide (TPR) repeat protein/transcriptional regulator with XRE-family HTH domain